MPRRLALLAAPAHLVVLLAFFLPFYEVSCQGRPLATSSAYEIATGTAEREHEAPRLPAAAGGEAEDGHRLPRALTASLLLLPLLALAGGVAALLSARRPERRARAAAAASAWLGAAAALFLVVHLVLMRSEVRDVLQRTGRDRGELAQGLATMVSSSLDLSPEGGWILALVAALAAAGLSTAGVFLGPPPRAEAPGEPPREAGPPA